MTTRRWRSSSRSSSASWAFCPKRRSSSCAASTRKAAARWVAIPPPTRAATLTASARWRASGVILCACGSRPELQHHPSQIAEETRQERVEARRGSAVDDAVIVRQGQREHEARHELLAVPHRLHRRSRDAQDGQLGRVDDRREGGAADAAQARDGEVRAGDVAELELALAGLLGERRRLLGEGEDALLVDVLHDRHDETVRRVGGEADVPVLLQDETLAV